MHIQIDAANQIIKTLQKLQTPQYFKNCKKTKSLQNQSHNVVKDLFPTLTLILT